MTERPGAAPHEDSKGRNVTSLARIGWAAAKAAAGLSPYGPVGTVGVESLEIFVDHIRRYRDERVKQRLSAFARVILETHPDDVPEDLFDREIDQGEFHA